MSNVLIRNFEINDYDEVNKLLKEVHQLHVENRPDFFKETDKVLTKEEYIYMVNNHKTISILAEINSVVVGICIIQIKEVSESNGMISRKTAYMDDLNVHKDYRKAGIGKRLFDEGKKHAIDFKVDCLELMVWDFNESAINFYENRGMSTKSRYMQIKLN